MEIVTKVAGLQTKSDLFDLNRIFLFKSIYLYLYRKHAFL